MAYSITKKEIPPQPALVVRRQVNRSEIANTLAEEFPRIARYAQQNGLALTGPPFTRFIDISSLWTIEAGMPVAGTTEPNASGDSDIHADILPGGPAATTIHSGPYDKLSGAYAAMTEWIKAEGLTPAGAPWESYITDPGNHSDPADWKTEIFWPLAG